MGCCARTHATVRPFTNVVLLRLTSTPTCCPALQASHVLRQVPPRPDSLSRLALHKPLLNKTVALARGAECIAAAGEDFVASVPSNAVNQPQFWQPL